MILFATLVILVVVMLYWIIVITAISGYRKNKGKK